jgi:hypothetical protein
VKRKLRPTIARKGTARQGFIIQAQFSDENAGSQKDNTDCQRGKLICRVHGLLTLLLQSAIADLRAAADIKLGFGQTHGFVIGVGEG